MPGAAGIESLDLTGALFSGVPCGRTATGLNGIAKSGSFGAPDLLARLTARLARP